MIRLYNFGGHTNSILEYDLKIANVSPEEIETWCKENCLGKYFVTLTPIGMSDRQVMVYFEIADDLATAKLSWG